MKQKMIQISAYIIASLLAVPFNGCTVAKEFDVEYEAPDTYRLRMMTVMPTFL
jgi:hypothetical protein